MDDELQRIDDIISYNTVDYPSGHLTVDALRKRFSHSWDDALEKEGPRLDVTHFQERAFVRYGFGTVLGGAEGELAKTEVHPEGDRDDAVRDLTENYIHFGIADGPETAKQHIRRLTEAGAELARQHIGRGSP